MKVWVVMDTTAIWAPVVTVFDSKEKADACIEELHRLDRVIYGYANESSYAILERTVE